MNQTQREMVRAEVHRLLKDRADTFPFQDATTRTAPFHTEILEAFRSEIARLTTDMPYLVAIASWLHGLNTSLGTKFEKFAHILSGGSKRSFKARPITTEQGTAIGQIIRDLKARTRLPDLLAENEILARAGNTQGSTENALDFTADNYLETGTTIECIELKSVRPNSGEGRGEKQKILNGKAALMHANPSKQVKFFIGFPFDPTAPQSLPTSYDKTRFVNHLIEFKKFFHHDEILLGAELWDHLSGHSNTMEELLEITRDVVESYLRRRSG